MLMLFMLMLFVLFIDVIIIAMNNMMTMAMPARGSCGRARSLPR